MSCSTSPTNMDAIKAHIAAMHRQVQEWEAVEAQYVAFQERIQATVATQPTIIALDVGGMVYKTSKATLLAVEGSYFHALLASDRWAPDDSVRGAYFLDLHGPTFVRVLDYLRTGSLSMDGLNRWERRQLDASLEYLQLTDKDDVTPAGLVTWTWDWPQASWPSNVHVSRDGKVLHVSPCGASSARLFARGSAQVTQFRVQILDVATALVLGYCSVTCTTALEAVKGGCFTDFSSVVPKIKSPHQCMCRPGDVVGVTWERGAVLFRLNGKRVRRAMWLSTGDELVPFVATMNCGSAMIVYILE